jgi:hypothetical protein
MAFLFYHITTLAAKFFVVMETDIRMIKYLLIILAVSINHGQGNTIKPSCRAKPQRISII